MMTLRDLVLLLLTPLTFAVNSVSIRYYQLKIPNAQQGIRAFQGAFCLFAALLYAAVARELPSLRAVGLGVLFGICFFLTLTCSAVCYEIGPMSLTAILVNASLALPLMWSVCFLGERVSLRMMIGLLLICLTFLLSALGRREKGTRAGKRWMVLVTLAFLCNGASAILQKSYQRTQAEGNPFSFLSIAYLTAALLFFSAAALRRGKDTFFPSQRGWLYCLLIAAAGAGSFAGNGLLQSLCVRVPAGVLYPIANGGLCVVTAIASFVLFRERLTRWKLMSIASGVAGIAVLTL